MNKDEIMKQILKCRDSHTPEMYNTNREDLMLVTEGLRIRPGRVKNDVPFRQYFDINWQSLTPMWVLAFRKQLPLQVNFIINVNISLKVLFFSILGIGFNPSCRVIFPCFETLPITRVWSKVA